MEAVVFEIIMGIVGGSYIALALYALGFVLSYTAVVFTVPEKEHAYEGR